MCMKVQYKGGDDLHQLNKLFPTPSWQSMPTSMALNLHKLQLLGSATCTKCVWKFKHGLQHVTYGKDWNSQDSLYHLITWLLGHNTSTHRTSLALKCWGSSIQRKFWNAFVYDKKCQAKEGCLKAYHCSKGSHKGYCSCNRILSRSKWKIWLVDLDMYHQVLKCQIHQRSTQIASHWAPRHWFPDYHLLVTRIIHDISMGRIEILFMILVTSRWQCTVTMLLETTCHCLNQVTSYTTQINHGTTQQAKQNLRHLLPGMHQSWVLPYQSQCHGFGSVPQCRHSCKEPESEPAKGLHLEQIGAVCIRNCMRYLDIIHTQCGPLQSDSPLWWHWTVQVTAFISLPVDLTHVEEDKWNIIQLFLRVVQHFNLLTSYTWQRQGPGRTCLK